MKPPGQARNPPRLARRLLVLIVGRRETDEAESVLNELFKVRVARDGYRAACRWYWRQMLGFMVWMHSARLLMGPRHTHANHRYRTRIGATTDSLLQDVRFAVRQLRRAPGISIGGILTLALGIGANATMFGIIDRLLLSPPEHVVGAEEVQRIYLRGTYHGAMQTANINYPDFTEFQKIHAFSAVAAYEPLAEYTVGSGIGATRVKGILASWEMFALLGVAPHIGNFYSADQDRIGAPVTAVLGYGLWQRVFGADTSVVGRSAVIDGTLATIVGVAPRGFTGAGLERVDVWLPLRATLAVTAPSMEWTRNRSYLWLRVVGRLRPDGVASIAAQEATLLHHRGVEEDEFTYGEWYDPRARIELASIVAARSQGIGEESSSTVTGVAEAKVAMWLGGISLLVLLIACANVANLLLARAVERSREFAVRLAVGVSRIRLLRQLLLETLVLAALSGVAALAVASWGGTLIRGTLLRDVFWSDTGFDSKVLLFTIVVTVLTGLVAGTPPGIQANRYSESAILGSARTNGSPRRSRVHQGLLVFQVALSAGLLVGTGLFVESLRNALSKDIGLQMEQVALVSLEFEEEHSGLDGTEANRRCRMVADRLASLPEVTHASLASVPFGSEYGRSLRVPGIGSVPMVPGRGPAFKIVDAGYFPLLGIELREGRALTKADQRSGAPVMVVNKTMAETLWPNESAVGKCVLVGRDPECSTVVGVVEDVTEWITEGPAPMTYYLPLDVAHGTAWGRDIYVRFTSDPERTLGFIRQTAYEAAPGIRFVEVSTLPDILAPQARSWKLGATIFTAFGGLALIIAGVGLFSVLVYGVARRKRELGVRTAVGASRGSVIGLVFRDAIRMTIAGLLLGLAMTLLVGAWIEPLLFDVSAHDPAVYGKVILTLLMITAFASAIPAWKASRVDPVDALRQE